MCAGSAASTREGERLASKASSCARCLRRSIWDSTIPSTKRQGGASVRLKKRGLKMDGGRQCSIGNVYIAVLLGSPKSSRQCGLLILILI
jgi:hypothetical protein